MTQPLRTSIGALTIAGILIATPATAMPAAHADDDNNTLIPNNKRLNDSVVNNVYTIQQQAGCTNDVKISPALQSAAQRHTDDVLNNRSLDGDVGSDGSTPQDRANAAGFVGQVTETVAINPALAISGIEILNQWYYNPADLAIMQNCANTMMGVWSENSFDRTVVVAVYGQPAKDAPTVALSSIDPNPDYDASDELEYANNWWAWILRGVYPPPAYPPS
jgi:uncharacterized protein YkwD